MKIFLYLSNTEIAKFVLIFPEFHTILLDTYFIRRYISRFDSVTCNITLDKLRSVLRRENYAPLKVGTWWCACDDYLPSGHCVACLLNPHLLLSSPFHSYCFCVDHCELWGLSNLILWSSNFWPNLDGGWNWPECGAYVDETRRLRLWKKAYERCKEYNC